MKLLIVESPNKTKKIRSMLGSEWVVEASFGHVRDLPTKKMGVGAPDFRPEYEVISRAKKKISQLKQLAAKAEAVYLATDPDREGEAIAWHLQQALKVSNPFRVSFHAITEKEVKKGVSSPGRIDMNLVAAQETRRVIDRLVGFRVSPVLSQLLGGSRLSAGRVQSPALRLVVEREREIRDFKPVDHYGIRAYFEGDQGAWFADWLTPKNDKEGHGYFTDQKKAADLVDSIRSNPVFEVISSQSKQRRANAPAPFITSTLQQAASVQLSISPDACMDIAQNLFADGLITYHRTDSPNLSEEALSAIREYLAQVAKSKGFDTLIPEKPNVWNSKGNAQEAHEAIRPTDVNHFKPAGLSEEALKVYQMIWRRAVASQMLPALFNVQEIQLKSVEEGLPFLAKGEIRVFAGWQMLMENDSAEESEDENDNGNPVPANLTTGDHQTSQNIELQSKKTKAPKRYTEASLIKRLEADGIGRPSTYASIMKTIQQRGYVSIKKKMLHPEQLGETVHDHLVGRFRFVEIPFTAKLEEGLDDVARGQKGYLAMVKAINGFLDEEIGEASAEIPSFACPACDSGRLFRYLTKDKARHYWRCDDKGCGQYFNDHDEKPMLKKKAVVTSEHDCPACEQHKLVKRSGAHGVFWGCGGYPSCKHTVKDLDGSPMLEQEGIAV